MQKFVRNQFSLRVPVKPHLSEMMGENMYSNGMSHKVGGTAVHSAYSHDISAHVHAWTKGGKEERWERAEHFELEKKKFC